MNKLKKTFDGSLTKYDFSLEEIRNMFHDGFRTQKELSPQTRKTGLGPLNFLPMCDLENSHDCCRLHGLIHRKNNKA